MTPNELISTVALNLGDGGFVAIAREEYIAFVNDVGHDIWLRSKAMHAIRHYPLPEGARAYELPDTDILEFAELQVRTISPPPAYPPPEGDSEPEIYDDSHTPVHQQEKPVHQNISEGLGLWTNVGNTLPHTHLTIELRGGRYVILSPRPFEASQVLHAHAVIHSPRYAWLDAAAAHDPTATESYEETLASSIWEPLRNVFIEGCTWRAARRLSNYTQDPVRRQIWNDARDLYYRMYLPDTIHFIHALKDGSSVLHVRPGRYLDE